MQVPFDSMSSSLAQDNQQRNRSREIMHLNMHILVTQHGVVQLKNLVKYVVVTQHLTIV